jgi:hypothetical protein
MAPRDSRFILDRSSNNSEEEIKNVSNAIFSNNGFNYPVTNDENYFNTPNFSYNNYGNGTKKVNNIFFDAFSNTNPRTNPSFSCVNNGSFLTPSSLTNQSFNYNKSPNKSPKIKSYRKSNVIENNGNNFESFSIPFYVPKRFLSVDEELITSYIKEFKKQRDEVNENICEEIKKRKLEFLPTTSLGSSEYENIVKKLFEEKFDYLRVALKNVKEDVEVSFFKELDKELIILEFNKENCDKIFNKYFKSTLERKFEIQNNLRLEKKEIIKRIKIWFEQKFKKEKSKTIKIVNSKIRKQKEDFLLKNKRKLFNDQKKEVNKLTRKKINDMRDELNEIKDEKLGYFYEKLFECIRNHEFNKIDYWFKLYHRKLIKKNKEIERNLNFKEELEWKIFL